MRKTSLEADAGAPHNERLHLTAPLRGAAGEPQGVMCPLIADDKATGVQEGLMVFYGARKLGVLSGFGLVLPILGCEPSAPREFPEGLVRDSAGIRIVDYVGIPGNLPSWSVSSEPIVEIGSFEGAGPDVFGRIESIAVLSDGAIAVADGLSSEVRTFDRQGEHVWTAGRRGGGPGEFTSLEGAFITAGDSIVVAGGGRVMSVFGPDGSYARQFRLDSLPTDYPAGPIIVGVTYEGAVIGGALAMPRFEPGYYRSWLTLVFYDNQGRSAGTFGPLLHGEGVLTMGAGGTYSSRLVAMGRRTQVAVGRDGAAVTTQERFEIKKLNSRGQVEAIVRVAVDPVPVDDVIRRQYLDRSSEASDPDAARRMRQEAVFADALPALGRIVYDMEGHLWVEEYVPPYADRPAIWWVLDPDGDFLALVSPPRDLDIQHVGAESIVGIALDELDVPRVRVHQLTRSTGRRP